jgi:hypothetical protein
VGRSRARASHRTYSPCRTSQFAWVRSRRTAFAPFGSSLSPTVRAPMSSRTCRWPTGSSISSRRSRTRRCRTRRRPPMSTESATAVGRTTERGPGAGGLRVRRRRRRRRDPSIGPGQPGRRTEPRPRTVSYARPALPPSPRARRPAAPPTSCHRRARARRRGPAHTGKRHLAAGDFAALACEVTTLATGFDRRRSGGDSRCREIAGKPVVRGNVPGTAGCWRERGDTESPRRRQRRRPERHRTRPRSPPLRQGQA